MAVPGRDGAEAAWDVDFFNEELVLNLVYGVLVVMFVGIAATGAKTPC